MKRTLICAVAIIAMSSVRVALCQEVPLTPEQNEQLKTISQGPSELNARVPFNQLPRLQIKNTCPDGNAGKDCRFEKNQKLYKSADNYLENKLDAIWVGKTNKDRC